MVESNPVKPIQDTEKKDVHPLINNFLGQLRWKYEDPTGWKEQMQTLAGNLTSSDYLANLISDIERIGTKIMPDDEVTKSDVQIIFSLISDSIRSGLKNAATDKNHLFITDDVKLSQAMLHLRSLHPRR